jgi:hypothetical protein
LVSTAEARLEEDCLAEVRPAELCPTQVRPVEARRTELRVPLVRLAKVCPAQVCPAEGRVPEIRAHRWANLGSFSFSAEGVARRCGTLAEERESGERVPALTLDDNAVSESYSPWMEPRR